MVQTKRLILHLGSNMGHKLAYLTKGLIELELAFGEPLALSKIYQTKAWGLTDQADFLNLAVIFQSNLIPKIILDKLKAIELSIGRKPRDKWEERELDIDIIFYETDIIDMPTLIIPHKLMHERRFVLVPLNEICADFIHPVMNQPISEILSQCSDPSPVELWRPN